MYLFQRMLLFPYTQGGARRLADRGLVSVRKWSFLTRGADSQSAKWQVGEPAPQKFLLISLFPDRNYFSHRILVIMENLETHDYIANANLNSITF